MIVKELSYRFGSYRLNLLYHDSNYVQVSMNDISMRLPLLWGTGMTKEEADGTIQLFKAIGFFDMPISTK